MSSPDLALYKKALHTFYSRVQDIESADVKTVLEDATRYLYALYRKYWNGTDLGCLLHAEMLEELLEQYEWPMNRVSESSTTPIFTLKKAHEFLPALTDVIVRHQVSEGYPSQRSDEDFGRVIADALKTQLYRA